MHELKEADREAILLRYFENRPLAQVGEKLGLGENAARMRVERALEKMRGLLAKRGIAATEAFAAGLPPTPWKPRPRDWPRCCRQIRCPLRRLEHSHF